MPCCPLWPSRQTTTAGEEVLYSGELSLRSWNGHVEAWLEFHFTLTGSEIFYHRIGHTRSQVRAPSGFTQCDTRQSQAVYTGCMACPAYPGHRVVLLCRHTTTRWASAAPHSPGRRYWSARASPTWHVVSSAIPSSSGPAPVRWRGSSRERTSTGHADIFVMAVPQLTPLASLHLQGHAWDNSRRVAGTT